MSVIVLDRSKATLVLSLAGTLAKEGLLTVPEMPADTNPGHFLATATPGGRLGWALAVARVASMAASVMTYGDDIAVDGRPTWNPDLFDNADRYDGDNIGGIADTVRSALGSAIYNAVSNGGADFLPTAAAAILTGARDSIS